MTLLAIDCAANLCAACIWHDGEELGREVLDLGKGHAEHLMAVIETAMEVAGRSFKDLDRIVVSVGPGSFTGVRVGVSTARGLALTLKIPAVGVSTLEAIAAEADEDRNVLAAIDGGRDGLFAAVYDPFGAVLYDPAGISLEDAVGLAVEFGAVIAGSAAARIAALGKDVTAVGRQGATADLATYARLGAAKEPTGKPVPLYLRAPDAKPQAGFILPRRSS